MFGRKCSLCGGRLDSRNICTECGLDNTKTDENYRMNQSSCDGEPLTHVHQEPQAQTYQQPPAQAPRKAREQTYRQPPVQKRREPAKPAREKDGKKTAAVVIGIIVTALGVLPNIVSSVKEHFVQDTFYSDYGDYDPYEYVTRELADGEEYDVTLIQGDYVVGVHIPEGCYTLTNDKVFTSINVEDEVNSIWLYESLDEETTKLSDVRLYEGARVKISGAGVMNLHTSNGQTSMVTTANPLTEEVALPGASAVAGTDFEPGVYDLELSENMGNVNISIYDEDNVMLNELNIWLDAESRTQNIYHNVVLPKGAAVQCDNEGMKLSLIPADVIESQDYLSYYRPQDVITAE